MKKANQRAQSIMEFAITVPLLLLMLVGIFDLGRAVFFYSSITNAAREGARYGIINPDYELGIRRRVKNYSFGVDPAELVITVNKDDSTKTVTISVSYLFIPATPLIGTFLGEGDGISLQTETTMVIEK